MTMFLKTFGFWQTAALIGGVTALSSIAYQTIYDTPETTAVSPELLKEPIMDSKDSDQVYTSYRDIRAFEDSEEQCKANVLPSFINVSLGWGYDDNLAYGDALRSLSPPTIVVTAGGNDSPKPIPPDKIRFSQENSGIIVGSLAPDGKRSHFSQEHEEVHILAPADHYQSSADENGIRRQFGGTSGAAPLGDRKSGWL